MKEKAEGMKVWKIVVILLMVLMTGCEANKDVYKDKILINDESKLVEEKREELTNEVKNNMEDCIVSYSEEEYKEQCLEIEYNKIDESWVGKLVTKELMLRDGESNEKGIRSYIGAATEDFIENIESYQKTYKIYYIEDCRYDQTFTVQSNDIMRIYGVIESVKVSYETGQYIPTIKVFYMDYVRQYGEDISEVKSEQEIIEEREQILEENIYKDSLNSDYNGTTKNKDNMNELELDEFLLYCDEMNYQNIVNDGAELVGRYVKIRIQVSDRKKFTSDSGKEKCLGEWAQKELVQDFLCSCKLYYERTGEYIYNKAQINTAYFLNTEGLDAFELEEGDNLIVYGQLVNHNAENGKFEILIRYYEKES